MNSTVKGRQMVGDYDGQKTIEVDVSLSASSAVGVWLVDGGGRDSSNSPFRMIVGASTKEDAARSYAKHLKRLGRVLPGIFRVFPLVNLEPIALLGIIDQDGDEEWSAFQNAWVEVRL